jgi:hypothetical protein
VLTHEFQSGDAKGVLEGGGGVLKIYAGGRTAQWACTRANPTRPGGAICVSMACTLEHPFRGQGE